MQRVGLRIWKLLFGESMGTCFKYGREVFKQEVLRGKVGQLL